MVRLLRRLLHEPPQEVPLELRITVQGDVLVVSADTLARIRSQVLAHHKLNTGREAVAKELLSALWRNSRWAEDVDPADHDHERAEFYERVHCRLQDVPECVVADTQRAGSTGPSGRRRAAAANLAVDLVG
jgi:hypothetical protein